MTTPRRYPQHARGNRGSTLLPSRSPGVVAGKKTLNSSSSSSQPNPSSQAASLLAAGVIALQATPAMALNAIELQDQRQTNKNGLQLIYEVRARPI